MFSVHPNSDNLLTIRFAGQVTADEMAECCDAATACLPALRPGFRLLTDLSELETMDVACAAGLGALMDRFAAHGIGTVVRVIPEPRRDLGFNILSTFHYGPGVRTAACETLAEAQRALEE